MVLKLQIILISLFISTTTLFDTHQKEVDKTIASVLNTKDYHFSAMDCKEGDLKKIFVEEELRGFVFVGSVASCNLGGCTAGPKVASKGSEFFDILLVTDPEYKILKLSILDYFSDYGYEISSRKYLKRFIGKELCSFSDASDDIDAISGATISSNALEGKLDQLCFTLAQ